MTTIYVSKWNKQTTDVAVPTSNVVTALAGLRVAIGYVQDTNHGAGVGNMLYIS